MLWTDLIDPADLTGYARAVLADYEREQGHARPVAALPRGGRTSSPASSRVRPASSTWRSSAPTTRSPRSASAVRQAGHARAARAGTEHPGVGVRAAARPGRKRHRRAGARDHPERDRRGRALGGRRSSSGCAASSSHRQGHDQPGQLQDRRRLRSRRVDHTVTAGTAWSTSTADAIDQTSDVDRRLRGPQRGTPGAILASSRVIRALASLDQFSDPRWSAVGRGRRRSQRRQRDLSAAGLPPIVTYNRRVSIDGVTTKVIADDKLLLLPEPVDTTTGTAPSSARRSRVAR
jgi:hypothetical protein